MGGDFDLPAMEEAATFLEALGIPHEPFLASAHRTPGAAVLNALFPTADWLRFTRDGTMI